MIYESAVHYNLDYNNLKLKLRVHSTGYTSCVRVYGYRYGSVSASTITLLVSILY